MGFYISGEKQKLLTNQKSLDFLQIMEQYKKEIVEMKYRKHRSKNDVCYKKSILQNLSESFSGGAALSAVPEA